jgi:AcrR family transcriptional regulator
VAYEVVKTIKGREYRYRVESYRDPETGRVRNRWTYLGKAGDGKHRVRRRAPTSQTRQRLIDAFLRLVEAHPWSEVTPDAVAREAGLAHGTFYRYFKDRLELFDLCTHQANEMLDQRLAELGEVADSREAERERLRSWVIELFRRPTAPPGLMRAWLEIGIAKLREQRRARRVAGFERYINALRERGYVVVEGEVRPIAIALSVLVETFTRRTVAEHALLSEDDYAAACISFDRLIFWIPPSRDGRRIRSASPREPCSGTPPRREN